VAILALAGCGRSPTPPPEATTAAVPPATDTAQAEAAKAEEARAAELAAKEKELADREAAVKQQELEQELARRDAENAAAEAAAAKAKASAAAAKKTPAKAAPVVASTPAKAAPPPPIVVPAGTQLAVALTSEVSTKTATVGDRVDGRLNSDLMVDGRRAAAAGAAVQGSVTQVVSGSKKIGGTPTLGLAFDTLVLANGTTVPITGQLVQQGKSDTGKDTAKIVGGAAAGAIIGHQVNSKNGSVVGGILGGAAGTAVAHSTGGEVILPAGTVVSVTTQAPFQVDMK
jgi:hypothetical protein